MRSLFAVAALLFPFAASAMSIDWTGVYRIEWVQVDRPTLSTPPGRKAYGLNYLGLSPRIIASDGVEVVGKFDVLANQDSAYTDSQMGQLWGQSNPTRTNVLSDTKHSTGLNVSQLYLNVNQEYGSLLVGRAPYQFGLGITWNAGNGPFDHWATTSDLVAYKFIVGNLSFMPMLSQVAAPAGVAQGGVVQDQTFQFMYESEESGSMIGAVISRRKSADTPTSNDIVGGQTGTVNFGGHQVTQTSPYSMQRTGFTLARRWDSFRFRMEAGFMNGTYGLVAGTGDELKNNSYGIALEMEFPRPESKWDFSLRTGVASGDDPSTADIEGYAFHRNYDVGMLLFNHRLGNSAVDFLGTGIYRETSTHSVGNSLDDEAISNAMYVSPKIKYAWTDRLDLVNTLTYAQLMTNPTNQVDFKKDLGLEWDIGLDYKPRTNMRWVNQLGLLFPGAAFKAGSAGYDNGFTFGFETKAAITF